MVIYDVGVTFFLSSQLKKIKDDKKTLYYFEWKDNLLRQQIYEIRWQESHKGPISQSLQRSLILAPLFLKI